MSYVYKIKSYCREPFDESKIPSPSFSADGRPLTIEEAAAAKKQIVENIRKNNPDGMISSYEIFYMEAESYSDCFFKCFEFLEDRFGEGNFDIDAIKSVKDKNGEEIQLVEKCNCMYCSYDRVSPDLRMEFTCPNPKCKKEIKVADNGWSSILCRECKTEINREDVKMGSDGAYYIERKSKKSTKKGSES